MSFFLNMIFCLVSGFGSVVGNVRIIRGGFIRWLVYVYFVFSFFIFFVDFRWNCVFCVFCGIVSWSVIVCIFIIVVRFWYFFMGREFIVIFVI